MTQGFRCTPRTPAHELDALRGALVTQVATPAEQHGGFRLHNFNNTIKSISKVGGGLALTLDGVDEPMVFASAVLTCELP